VAQLLLTLVVLLVLGSIGYGVYLLVQGGDPGLEPVEPDGVAVDLPGTRPLTERDLSRVRFDVGLRGYRMDQVDRALRRAGYDVGYKEELINVLEAEIEALRDGRTADADTLRAARDAALGGPAAPTAAGPGDGEPPREAGEVARGDGAPAGEAGEMAPEGTDGPGGADPADPDATAAEGSGSTGQHARHRPGTGPVAPGTARAVVGPGR
jgi:DivIVA domain-containing protein